MKKNNNVLMQISLCVETRVSPDMDGSRHIVKEKLFCFSCNNHTLSDIVIHYANSKF